MMYDGERVRRSGITSWLSWVMGLCLFNHMLSRAGVSGSYLLLPWARDRVDWLTLCERGLVSFASSRDPAIPFFESLAARIP